MVATSDAEFRDIKIIQNGLIFSKHFHKLFLSCHCNHLDKGHSRMKLYKNILALLLLFSIYILGDATCLSYTAGYEAIPPCDVYLSDQHY